MHSAVTDACARAGGASEPEPFENELEEALKPIRVLIADDEPTLRLALSMFLVRHGYEVGEAGNADQAFEMATKGGFQVAMVDVRMPGDGIALLRRLEDAGWTGNAILMTGDPMQPGVRDEIDNGRPYLTKPFDMMAAVRLIASLHDSAVKTN